MVLLDTCALLWLAGDQAGLSQDARATISSSAGSLAVSAISAFEIATKHRQGKLALPLPADKWYGEALRSHGVREIPVDGQTAILAAMLPPVHRDPCDRLIIATAMLHQMPIVTPDRVIARYPDIRAIW
ncbi:MAG TPA: type II toxin-antitoxin system VapC family toxin [Phycisphaerae bacterium]|nr:type II toxin-antitoxin system VapC family toxin [Phycisphaerae bacterium]